MATTDMITVNITPGEILQPDATIELAAARTIDPRSAQGAVRLTRGGERRPVSVRLAKRGRTLLVRTAGLPAGAYELTIEELLDAKGRLLADRLVVPFLVIPLAGEVPSELRVEHAVRLAVGELEVERIAPDGRPPSGYVDVVKAVGRKDGEAHELAFDETGARVNLAELIAGVSRRRFERFGRLHETLWRRLEGATEDERVEIVVWPALAVPPAPYEKPAERRMDTPPDGEREVADIVRKAGGKLQKSLARVGIEPIAEDDPLDPSVRATATVAQVRELGRDDAVGVVLFDDPTAITDLGNSIAVARSDRAHAAGFDGTGIRVAVWEDGPSVTTNLVFAGRFTTTPAASNHARLTSAIIKNTEVNLPHGHAPDCDLYSANTFGNDALRWAVRDPQRCTVVSQSFHRNTEPGGAGLQADDLLKDWLALRWPFPTIVQAAGNFWATDPDGISPPESEFVNHKGYNSLAVGNHNDTAGAMAGGSVFRNPTTAHGDRELPEVAANGTAVSANTITDSGTSFAAPAAAGVTALLQDVTGCSARGPRGAGRS